MENKEKRVFISSAVCTVILILGTLMSFMGAISSSGGLSLFAYLCIANFLSLIYLSAVLFRKKKDMHLGISLCANALVSLLTVCFFFSWQELFICITFTLLALNYFIKDSLNGKKKYFLLALSLSAACIIIFTITAFNSNINQAQNGKIDFDMEKWAYNFSPFVFAVVNAALADLLGLLINDSLKLKNGYRQNRILFLPLLIVIVSTAITAIIAANGAVIGSSADSLSETVLIVSSMAAYVSAAVFPFLYSFVAPHRQENTKKEKK